MASNQARRAKMRQQREQRARRQLLLIVAGVAVIGVVILVLVMIIQQPTANAKKITFEDRPYAHGKTLGPDTAAVTIEEWGDFQ